MSREKSKVFFSNLICRLLFLIKNRKKATEFYFASFSGKRKVLNLIFLNILRHFVSLDGKVSFIFSEQFCVDLIKSQKIAQCVTK